MIRLVVSLFLAAVYLPLLAASEIDSLIKSGVHAAYNFDFYSAENSFQRIIEINPEDPRGYYHLSQMHLWYYLGSRDKGQLKTFDEFTRLAFEKLDAISDSVENQPVFIDLEANLYLQKAMVAGAEESTLDAFFATKSSYSRFEEVLEIDSTYSRAYLGLGLLEYALSYVPGLFKWALTIAGLGSDKEKGFNLVRKAMYYANSKAEISEISYHYSKMLLEYAGDVNGSIKLLQNLRIQYPDNILFRYQLALAFIEAKELDSALEQLRFIISYDDNRFIQTVAFSYFLVGEIQFRFGNYRESIKQYENFLELSRGFEYSGMAYYNIGLSYLFLDEIISARKYFVLARNGNSDISDDLYAGRRSEQIFNSIDEPTFLKVVRARNFLQTANYDSVITYLTPHLDSLRGDDRAEAEIILAEAYIYNNQFDSAIRILDEISINDIKNELWLKPYYFYLNALLKNNAINERQFDKLIAKAHDNNNYDFVEKITAKINGLILKKVESQKSSFD